MKRFALAATLLASTANLTADPLSTTLGLGSWAFFLHGLV